MTEKIDKSAIKNILVTRTDKLGDVILTLPLISEIKRIFPDANISFLVQSFLNDLLLGYEDIDELLFIDKYPTCGDRYDLIKAKGFDMVINVFPDYELAALFFTADIKHRIGTGYRWYSFLYNHKVKEHRKFCEKHEAQYNLNLLKSVTDEVKDEFNYKFKYTPFEKEALSVKLRQHNLDISSGYIIIHPGSRSSARDIPLNTLAEFVELFIPEYYNLGIVLTGVKEESGTVGILINSIQKEKRVRIVNLCGILSLKELLILIDNSRLFLSNSTGPIHIAGALEKKIIGFYPNEAPVNDTRWGPLSPDAKILNPKTPGGSMSEITSREIFDNAIFLLKK